jgi:rSAM/selenodomain-associated transferase 2
MEPHAPRLCVVVPTLDEQACLGTLLARLNEAPDADDRADLVVVSDGSSGDATCALAVAGGARLVRGPAGRGGQLRRGAHSVEARDDDVLLFLHADGVPDPGALARLRAALADPQLRWGSLDPRIDAEGLFYRLGERAARARVRCLGLVYGDCGLFVRAADYRAVGGFAELPLFEDLELSRRLRARGRPRLLAGAGLAVSARRWRAEGALRATLRNWIIQAAFLCGADPGRLARRYPPAPRGRGPGGVAFP